ncbi:MAG: hypothetical protein ABSF77_08900 [Spirochaetia bacterium]|jgi:hypothetical protein
MRIRRILLPVLVVLILAGGLISCSFLGMVSIDDRIAQFQTDLNSATRSTIYEDFHPTKTSDYNALKDPVTIEAVFPPLGISDTAYSLTVTDESNPATGVIVTVTGGPASFNAPKHLKLVMDTTGVSDYRIVSLAIDNDDNNYTVEFE